MRAGRVSTLFTFAALAVVCSTTLVASASALEPGVHIDPGSPAAKEYALPVSQARGAASGGEGSDPSSERLFGSGITPPSSGSGSGGSHAAPAGAHSGGVGNGSSRHGGSGSGAAGTARQATPLLVQRVAVGRSSSTGGSSALVLLAGGVGVLALGAFAGIVLKHSRRETSPT
jgi:hypothetical protein